MMNSFRPILIGLLLGCLFSAPATAELQGRVDGDFMAMPQAGEEASERLAGALQLEFHAYARKRPVTQNLDIELFARVDSEFEERDHADVRELIYSYSTRDWALRGGIGRVFWGVTESAHLVDVINQSDMLENLDGEDKLGQPMLAAAWTGDYGLWDLYWLPRQRSREYPGQGLFPTPVEIDDEHAVFEDSRGEQGHAFALRWYKPIGIFDLALSAFEGVGREPRLVPCAREGSGRPGTENGPNCDLESAFNQEPSALDLLLIGVPALLGLGPSEDEIREQETQAALEDVVLVPHYDDWLQFGLELQGNVGNWALKLEAIRREAHDEEHHAAVVGFEYSHGAAFGLPADFGYLMEYLYDDRKDDADAITPFANDLMIGWRVMWNDVQSTQLLGGVITDLDHQSQVYALELSRRVGDSASAELELRTYSQIDPRDSLWFLRHTDSYRLTFSWYF